MVGITWHGNQCECRCTRCGNTDKAKMTYAGKYLLCILCDLPKEKKEVDECKKKDS